MLLPNAVIFGSGRSAAAFYLERSQQNALLDAPEAWDIDNMKRARQMLLFVGWTALAVWATLGLYVRVTNRWGVFAVAPALRPLLVVSIAITGIGALMCTAEVRHRRWDAAVTLITGLHAMIFWYAATSR